MHVISKKLSVYEVQPGMYISRLDRPWASTDYPLEGFYVKTKDDIYKLFSICEHVYIDEELSQHKENRKPNLKTPKHKKRANHSSLKKNKINISYPIKIVNKQNYHISKTFKKEVSNAKKRHTDLKKSIDQFFNQILEQKVAHIDPLKKVVEKTVDSIVANPDAMMWLVRTKHTDNYAYNFVLKQTVWALAIARQLGLNRTDMQNLALASILSGVGKNKIPLKIIQKEPNFSGGEFKIFKHHVEHSVKILQDMKNIHPQVIMAVENHCEFINGSGYPRGLSGVQIPISSQILSIASYYESLSCPRNLKHAISPNDAIDKVFEQRNKKFHNELVDHFIQAIGIYPTGTLVQLDDGEVGVIIEHQESLRLTPQVMILRNKQNSRPEQQKIIDLSKAKNRVAIQQSLAVGSYGVYNQEITDAVIDLHNSWGLKQIIGF